MRLFQILFIFLISFSAHAQSTDTTYVPQLVSVEGNEYTVFDTIYETTTKTPSRISLDVGGGLSSFVGFDFDEGDVEIYDSTISWKVFIRLNYTDKLSEKIDINASVLLNRIDPRYSNAILDDGNRYDPIGNYMFGIEVAPEFHIGNYISFETGLFLGYHTLTEHVVVVPRMSAGFDMVGGINFEFFLQYEMFNDGGDRYYSPPDGWEYGVSVYYSINFGSKSKETEYHPYNID